jgi:hypothetical protein
MQTMVEPLVDGYDRVRGHTSAQVNQRIDDATRIRIERTKAGGPVAIGRRLAELDREWDIDRALMANFAVLGGAGFVGGLSQLRPFQKSNGWLYLVGVQMGFLLLHATAGWCPPVVLFRRLGVRTAREIQAERGALEAALAS